MLRLKDIVNSLSEKHGISKVDAKAYAESVFELMKNSLLSGSDICVKGLFTMGTKTCMGRDVVMPANGRKFKAEPYRKFFCRFATGMKQVIKKK